VSGLDSIADVLAVAVADVCDHFTIVASDWSRILTVRSLLGAAVVQLVCTIDAGRHTRQL